MNETRLTQKNEIKILQNASVKKSREKKISTIQTEWRMERHSVVARCLVAINYTKAIYQSKYQIYNLCLLFIGVIFAFSICNTHRRVLYATATCEHLNKRNLLLGRIRIFIFNWDLFWCFVVYRRCVSATRTYHITIDSESTESWAHFHSSLRQILVLLSWCAAITTVAHSHSGRESACCVLCV